MRCDRPLSALAHAFSRPSVRAGTTVTRARCGGAPPPPPGVRTVTCRSRWPLPAVGRRSQTQNGVSVATVGVGRLKKKLFSSTRNEHSRAATPHRPPVSGPVASGGSGAVHGLTSATCQQTSGALSTQQPRSCVCTRLARAYHGTCTHWSITSSLMPGAPPP